jgi:hypothetical protein
MSTAQEMKLQASTQEAIRRLEKVTGRRAQTRSDTTLAVAAKIQMARRDDPFHIISINPNATLAPDYLICFHCGVILRLFENPPEARFEFQPVDEGERAVAHLVGRKMSECVRRTTLIQITSRVFVSLMLQLRWVPLGLRVNATIRREYPDLVGLQDAFVRRQLDENARILSPEAQDFTPEALYSRLVGMNAAYAEFWARMLNEPKLATPYADAGFGTAGRALLDATDRLDPAPTSDRALTDEWARVLGMTGWYEWVPYRLNPLKEPV